MKNLQKDETQLDDLVTLYDAQRGDIRQVFSAWKLTPESSPVPPSLEQEHRYIRIKKALSILCGFDAIPHLYDQGAYESGIRYLVAVLRL